MAYSQVVWMVKRSKVRLMFSSPPKFYPPVKPDCVPLVLNGATVSMDLGLPGSASFLESIWSRLGRAAMLGRPLYHFLNSNKKQKQKRCEIAAFFS